MNEPKDYSFESLYRVFVDKEKSGFDQCRNRMIGWLDKRTEDLLADDKRGWLDDWHGGMLQAYTDVLDYLKGVVRSGNAEPEQHDTGATG